MERSAFLLPQSFLIEAIELVTCLAKIPDISSGFNICSRGKQAAISLLPVSIFRSRPKLCFLLYNFQPSTHESVRHVSIGTGILGRLHKFLRFLV